MSLPYFYRLFGVFGCPCLICRFTVLLGMPWEIMEIKWNMRVREHILWRGGHGNSMLCGHVAWP
jgi:hypothetical protein